MSLGESPAPMGLGNPARPKPSAIYADFFFAVADIREFQPSGLKKVSSISWAGSGGRAAAGFSDADGCGKSRIDRLSRHLMTDNRDGLLPERVSFQVHAKFPQAGQR